MKDNILPEYPEVLINIKRIDGLDYIREENDSLTIGALTRLEDIALNTLVKERYPALAEAAAKTASPHIREQGTIAGNICQSNRCWYYWVPDNRFYCIRKGGKRCYAYAGEAMYHSIYGSTRVNDTPCVSECPAGVNIPDYMSKLREGDIDSAAVILMDSNPFPAITGRVCPHFCESACNRDELDEAVSIRNIERFIGNHTLENAASIYKSPEVKNTGTVAVIGSGPAGISCAWYLRKAGYSVTVFEAMDEPGGMLTYGIPSYRLPKDIVKKQISALVGSGINFKTGPTEGKIDDIRKISGDYDAVFMATGAWKEGSLGINGEELMVSGTEFLRNNKIIGESSGKKVAVMGGGNVAIDVARTLLRLGAEPVILYRRGREEMPAIAEEVIKAEEENIEMQFLTLPVSVKGQEEKIVLECTRIKLGAVDESGRPRPELVEGSEFTVEYDAVIKATGEVPDYTILPAELLNADERIEVSIEGLLEANIFAGGDCVTGPSTVIQAITSGRNAAESIDRYLGGKGIRKYQASDGTQPRKFDKDYLQPTIRNNASELAISERVKSMELEETGNMEQEKVIEEAGRCFNCGCLAVNSSDIAPVLIALDAKIRTTRRSIDAEHFFSVKGDNSTIIENEIVTEIELPPMKTMARSKFIKFALRKSIDFPIVNCAVALEIDNGTVMSSRICLNAVYNTPYRAISAEQYLLGKSIDDSTAEAAGTIAVEDVCPLPENTYKIQIAKILVKRAILACFTD
jgi:NADPH-dependent glutamate synthase beta subunit-like oxidoreductase/CO/xanthine dehydrogenase FAD-binding subunit